MSFVKSLNPLPQFDIGGTDLGIPFRMPNGQIGFVLGDTFAGTQPQVGGPNWRSPMLLRSNTHDVTTPITFASAARNAKQLWDYVHDNPEYSTILPCDAISIGNRIYLWVMVTQGLGNEKWCEIRYSDDLGESWTDTGVKWSTAVYGGKRTMVTWEKGGDGFVYVISTGGLARNKNAILHRVPEAQIADPAAWVPWGWNGTWGWGNPPGDDPTRGILPDRTKLGEICLRRIQGNLVFSGFDAGAYNAFVKVAAKPTDNWHTAPTYRPVKGSFFGAGGPDVVDRLYGCYIHPDSRFDRPGGFAMIVGQWAADGNPYRAMHYRISGITPVVPVTTTLSGEMTPAVTTLTDHPTAEGTTAMAFPFVPVAGGNNIISSGFRTPGRPDHNGIDFAAPQGEPIYAVEDGVVVRSGPASGFGNWIVIDHQATLHVDTVYGHMRAADLVVSQGMFVRAGQQIARVGNEGDSTGPHLHFEVWNSPGRFGGAAIDPKPLLVGSANPPTGTIDPAAGTFYGVDISNHQGNFDIAATKREGFSFMAAKCTEGDFFKDSFWPRNRDLMQQHFPGMFCGYHFARNGDPITAQVANLKAHLGDPNIPVMLDYEDPNTPGSGANLRQLVDAINAAGMRVCAIYLPRWYWQGHMGTPPLNDLPPLWNSHYVTASGFASVIYPGKGFAGWKDYTPGAPVEILQFSDKGRVAGKLVDVNAYEGTPDELRTLFGGAPGQLGVDDRVLDFWLQLLGPTGAGWPQLNNRSVVDALAEIGMHHGVPGMTPPPAGTAAAPLPATTADRARDVFDQIRGPDGTGWNQLGNRSLVDAIAAIAHQLGVPGY